MHRTIRSLLSAPGGEAKIEIRMYACMCVVRMCVVCVVYVMLRCVCVGLYAVLEITVGHWSFSDQFQHLADQNLF